MNNKNRGRRGATLAELAIVIAVIAIVAVMVTSFIVMIDSSRDLSQMKLDAMQDIVLAESVIENAIISGANEGKEIYVYSDRMLSIKNIETGKITSVKFTGGFLTVAYPDDEGRSNVVLELETVKSITFDALVDEETSDAVYYCTITYDVAGTKFDYTFCVNPYAGENIGG